MLPSFVPSARLISSSTPKPNSRRHSLASPLSLPPAPLCNNFLSIAHYTVVVSASCYAPKWKQGSRRAERELVTLSNCRTHHHHLALGAWASKIEFTPVQCPQRVIAPLSGHLPLLCTRGKSPHVNLCPSRLGGFVSDPLPAGRYLAVCQAGLLEEH